MPEVETDVVETRVVELLEAAVATPMVLIETAAVVMRTAATFFFDICMSPVPLVKSKPSFSTCEYLSPQC
jgi:hypothetical protein